MAPDSKHFLLLSLSHGKISIFSSICQLFANVCVQSIDKPYHFFFFFLVSSN